MLQHLCRRIQKRRAGELVTAIRGRGKKLNNPRLKFWLEWVGDGDWGVAWLQVCLAATTGIGAPSLPRTSLASYFLLCVPQCGQYGNGVSVSKEPTFDQDINQPESKESSSPPGGEFSV